MFKKNKIKNFYSKSKKIRFDIIEMLFKAQSGHSGPSLSIVEILNYLFFEKKIYKNFKKRDHFILSKWNAAPALYSALYNLGLIKKENWRLFEMLVPNSKVIQTEQSLNMLNWVLGR